MTRKGGWLACAAVLVLALACGLVPAAEVEGVKVPDQARLGEAGPALVLNGAGVRTRVFFRIYVGALYLEAKKPAADAVIADPGPKRIALHLLRDLGATQLLSALRDGLTANHSAAELARLESGMKQLEGIFEAVKEVKTNDIIHLDYAPGSGTRIVVNRADKGVIPGEEFHRALLRIWLGTRPADEDLKKAMLGG